MADARWTFQVVPEFDEAAAKAFEDFLETNLGRRIQQNAKRAVPVLSGDLKKSIIIQVDRNGKESILQVGVDPYAEGVENPPVDYGLYVERGTSRMAAQPYLRPAVYQARGVIVGSVAD